MNISHSERLSLWTFSLTLFLSAFLLFSVQPMFAKMVLPLLGGSPSVWNTCLVFFQMTLLAGYGYAHLLSSRPLKIQIAIHSILLLVTLAALPIAVPPHSVPPGDVNPIPWLLKILLLGVGLPFFTVSTSAPLIQKWFSGTHHPSSGDPYFLYAASNTGSLLALLSYPFLFEPAFPLKTQSVLWAAGYGALLVAIGACMGLWRQAQKKSAAGLKDACPPSGDETGTGEISWRPRLYWLVLSFAPSSLMLGITTFISTDIAAVPLIWIIPLFLYLLTFVLAFAKRSLIPSSVSFRALPLLGVPLVILVLMKAVSPVSAILFVHLAFFFVAALVCHSELAKRRPRTSYLTEYYLWISVGGVAGGLFNALLAPLLFKTVLEYPLAIILVCLLRPNLDKEKGKTALNPMDVILPLLMAALVPALYFLTKDWGDLNSLSPLILLKRAVLYAVPGLICFTFRNRSLRFALGLALFMLASNLATEHFVLGKHRLLYSERTFFGVNRVVDNYEKNIRLCWHGTTIHGAQSLDPQKRRVPLTYHHPDGPVGTIFKTAGSKQDIRRVAVIGLGAGALAAYARPGQTWDFYEIDPAVKRIATHPAYFTYLTDSAAQINIILGDGRLSLAQAPEHSYDLVILDAFSSDSIPMHLISKEAVLLYLSKLTDRGVLIFHISNRYLNLAAVLSSLSKKIGLLCFAKADTKGGYEISENGKTASIWAVIARRREDFAGLAEDSGWKQVTRYTKNTEWTDDYSNLLSAFMWK